MTVIWIETKNHKYLAVEDGPKSSWEGEITNVGVKAIVDALDKAFGVVKQEWDGAELTVTLEDDVCFADVSPIIGDVAPDVEVTKTLDYASVSLSTTA